ncbi:MAG: hypothetical protein HQK96_16385 [Nitrospirae bacterium]|nr:hypothetical protein [Nitrospirota bacterium]
MDVLKRGDLPVLLHMKFGEIVGELKNELNKLLQDKNSTVTVNGIQYGVILHPDTEYCQN